MELPVIQPGRRAETLPEDQMLLALEEVEQTEADAAAATERTAFSASSGAAETVSKLSLTRKEPARRPPWASPA